MWFDDWDTDSVREVILTIHSVGAYVVVLSFEHSVEMPFLSRVNQLVQRIMGSAN